MLHLCCYQTGPRPPCLSWTAALAFSVVSTQLFLHAAATGIFWKCVSDHADSQVKTAQWLPAALMAKPRHGLPGLRDQPLLEPHPCVPPLSIPVRAAFLQPYEPSLVPYLVGPSFVHTLPSAWNTLPSPLHLVYSNHPSYLMSGIISSRTFS